MWRGLVLLCLLAASARADTDRLGHLAFRQYTAEDGLAALDVVAGIQDAEGYIWAASPNGLFRYDGTRFRRYSIEDGLPSILITDLAVSPAGVLWGASSRGAFYRDGDRFVAIGGAVLPVDGMHLLAFADSQTWMTTDLGPFVVTGGTVEKVTGWPGGAAFGILVDGDGSVLVGRGTRLVRYTADHAFVDVGQDFVEQITSIVRDGAGRLWLRAGEHLWMQRRGATTFEDRSRDLLRAPIGSDGLRLALSATKTLLIPTSIGLIEIADDEARFVPTDLAPDARNIKSVWVDREGSLWLTSLGLHHELGRGLWRTISDRDGLPVSNVWSIAGLHDGRVAIGTDAGIAILGGAQPELIAAPSVTSVIEQPTGVLWIASHSKLIRHELATGRRSELGAESGLPPRKISVLAADRAGNLWLGVSGGGLYRGRVDDPRFERVTLPDAADVTVMGMGFDGERVWVTTSRGLYVRDRGSWHRFTTAQGLRDDNLLFLVVRRDGEVCASYLAPYGLTCLRYADGQIRELRHIDQQAGLSSPVPYFLAEDAAGRLWVGGATGVAIFDGDEVDRFTRAGGAPGDDCNANATWVAPSGDVWIGTSSGAGLFDGARYRGRPPLPTVKFGRGHVGETPLPRDARGSFTVAHDEARFEVELAALTFLDERRLEIQTQLIGYDDTWQPAESRVVRYSKLPPGQYRFAARARYGDGAWGPPTELELGVAMPFWRTIWFAVVLTISGLAAIVLVVRLRSRALRHRNLELEEIVAARTRDLVEANAKVAHTEKLSALGRLLAQLSHEINNPLNVIHNNVEPLEQYSTALCEFAEVCRRIATPELRAQIDELWARLDLDYIVHDSLEAFAATKEAISRVTKIHQELRAFLRNVPSEREPTDLAVAIRSTTKLLERTRPGIAIECALEPIPPISLHAGRIQQTLTNLIANAADSMEGTGTITIRTHLIGKEVRIDVEDHGPGVPPELRSKIFEPFFTTKEVGKGLGLGLSICREIAVAHGGSLELDQTYRDGARFVMTLPASGIA